MIERIGILVALHDITCKWCRHVQMLIRERKAGNYSMGVEVGLSLACDAKCKRARDLAYAEDERLKIGY